MILPYLSVCRKTKCTAERDRSYLRSGELCDRDDHSDQHKHDDRDLCPDPEWRHGETAYLDGLGGYLRPSVGPRLSCSDGRTPKHQGRTPAHVHDRMHPRTLAHA